MKLLTVDEITDLDLGTRKENYPLDGITLKRQSQFLLTTMDEQLYLKKLISTALTAILLLSHLEVFKKYTLGYRES